MITPAVPELIFVVDPSIVNVVLSSSETFAILTLKSNLLADVL